MKTLFLAVLFCIINTIAYAQTGTITNIQVSQRTDGSGFVDIYFDLSGSASAYNISLEASFNAGSSYEPVPIQHLSGDLTSVSPGNNKHLIWDGFASFPNIYNTQTMLKIIAITGNQLTEHLISYWEFNEGTGVTINDSHGNNDGTISNLNQGGWESGIINDNAIYLTSQEYITIPNDNTLKVSYPFTISGWFKFKSFSNVDALIGLSFRGCNAPYSGIMMTARNNGNRVSLTIGDHSGTSGCCCAPWNRRSFWIENIDLQTNVWYLISATITNKTTGIIYINDFSEIAQTSGTSNSTPKYGNWDTYINRRFNSSRPDDFGDVVYGGLGIWSKGLSQDEIITLWNNGNGLQYPF